ncbi:MAG: hypothetical protein EHM93_00240 [Bacteroidales bacterium]|nr:MAG: hypothetical protein EHM93_00240 [Bacteroidales bacterium]
MVKAYKKLLPILFLSMTLHSIAQKSYKPVIDYLYTYQFSFPANGLSSVVKDGKYGFIDQTGKPVVDYKYDHSYGFSDNGLAMVTMNGKWGLINSTGSEVLGCYEYGSMFAGFHKGLVQVTKNWKYGYIDRSGKLIIDCQFDYASSFSDKGLACVKKNGKWGYIDITGKMIIPYQFDYAYDFENDLALVLKNDKYGFINIIGKLVIDCVYDDAKNFWENGFAKVKKDGKLGWIDKSGKIFLDDVKDFSENGLAVARKGDKWGFIKRNGKTAIDYQFNGAFDFSQNGLAAVKKGEKWGFINEKGDVVIDYQFNGVTSFAPNGMAGVNKDGKRGYINQTGKFVISDSQYETVAMFSLSNWAFVKKNGKWTYIDQTGKEITGYMFDEVIRSYPNEFSKIKKDGKLGFIDPTGRILIKCQFDDVRSFINGLCAVQKGGKWGYIDEQGNLVVNYQFEDAGIKSNNGLICVKKNGKWGCVKQVKPMDDIANYVKTEIGKWQQKGKYETSDAYTARVTEENSRKKVEELMYLATQNIAPNYCDWKSIINEYDPDNQTFKVDIGGLSSIYVKVPVTEAEAFDTSANKLQFSNIQYALDSEGNVFLQKATINNPANEKSYVYSSTDNATFAYTQLNINLDPLKLNVQTASNTQSVNTETKTITVGQSDVDVNIPTNPQTNDKTFVVIIANENYQKEVKVKFASNDGKVFKQYCEKTLGIPSQNIHLAVDATFGNMKSEIKWIADVIAAYNGHAKVIFFYAGHGMPNETDKSSYLLPVDGFSSDFETAIKLNDLYSRLTANPVQEVTFIMDACFSGSARDNGMLAEARGVKIKPRTEVLNGNSIVFSAATGDETAYPYTAKQHGLFTYFLLKKLQETKGDVTYKDLFDYIKTNVGQQSVVVNQKSQTPQLQTSKNLQEWETMKLK